MGLPFQRVLVTGGAGFIGSHIVDDLLRDGCDVTVLDNFSSGSVDNLPMSQRLTIVKGDINDEQLVSKALKDIEVVFHEAAIVSVARSIEEPEFVKHVNLEGTLNLLRCATTSKVQRFVFASSAAVYGNTKKLPLSENAEKAPISPYGIGKLRSEIDCLNVHKSNGLEIVILRYFNVYGPRSNGGPYSGVINKFAARLFKKQSPVIYGTGRQTRDFINVIDVAKANILAASIKNAGNNIFNVGTGVPISIEHLAEVESDIIIGNNLIIPFNYQPNHSGDILDSFADISLIRNELGFNPNIGIQEGLHTYLAWMQTSAAYRRSSSCNDS